jgi:hypothetical protein
MMHSTDLIILKLVLEDFVLYQCNRNIALLIIMYLNTKHVSVWDPITHLE